MPDRTQDPMTEATRLTRQGRLAEATALIQRTLDGGHSPTATADDTAGTDDPIEAAFRTAGAPPHERASPDHQLRGPAATAPAAGAPGTALGGQFVERTYTGRAGARAYKLHVPRGYTGLAVPLVVMLHGCTQSPDDLAAGTRMNLLADEATFLVAYPGQAGRANQSKCWNWFRAADQQRDRGEPSLIAGITRQVMADYQVSPGRVYLAGFSAGGAMASVMAATYPDLYAAVGIHSGLGYGVAHDLRSGLEAMQHGRAQPRRTPARAVPTIVFHGDRDTTVHPRNADQIIAQVAATGQTTTGHGQAPGGLAYTRTIYHDASGRPIAERWLVHGLGHAWSGGSPRGSYSDPRGPDASREILRFFRVVSRQ